MTTYNGTNMTLEQNPHDGRWEFKNPAQTFIDPATFSTPDPDFPTAPVDDEEEQDTTCEEGYIYDSTLKKCVPEVTTYEGQVQAYMGTGDSDYQKRMEYESQYGTPEQQIRTSLTDPLSKGLNDLFPYATYAPTRAQMNEHMLILKGLENGYIMYDTDSGSYIQMPFQGKESISWQDSILNTFNYKSYLDYFEILEKGWQPASNQNSWKTLIQGDTAYTLKGGMLVRNDETGEMMVQFSKDRYITDEYGKQTLIKGFQTKINEALKLRQQGNDAMIDREGNVNINADGKGGYYNIDGKFVNAYGQVSATGSLSSGIKYLFGLQNSGLKIPTSLRDRLIKGLRAAHLTLEEKNKLIENTGFTTFQQAVNSLDNIDSWSMADVVTEVSDIGTQPGTPFVGRDTEYEQAQEVERVLEASKKPAAPVLTREEREGRGGQQAKERREESERQMRGAAQRESEAVSRGDKQQARQAREEYKTAVERSGYSRA